MRAKLDTAQHRKYVCLALLATVAVVVHFQLPCYSGTERFGCPSHELPPQYLHVDLYSKRHNTSNIIRSHCPTSNSRMLIVVNSRRKNVDVREWLRVHYDRIENVHVRFVVGKASGGEAESVTKAVENELSRKDDIILGNFEDIYANLDRKTFVRFEFVTDCLKNGAAFDDVLFQDDDTFFDHGKFETSSAKSDVLCGLYLWRNSWPYRRGKYALTLEQWPNGFYFPDYCAGACNVMTSSAVLKIYQAAMSTTDSAFPMDDVLFTGVLRQKAGIPSPTLDDSLCHHYKGNYQKLKQKINNSRKQYLRNLIERQDFQIPNLQECKISNIFYLK